VNSGLTSSTITVNYLDPSDSTPKTQTYTITNNIGAYYSYKSEREVKEYTVGTAEEPLAIDVTKMGPMIVQTGANEGQQLEIEIPAVNAVNLGVDDLDLSTEKAATEAIGIVGKAINQLSSVRSKIGAYANRLDHIIANLDTTEETMTQSYSRIMDVDMAEEITEYTNQQVLVQAATSVLAQANERPQQVLQLLQ
jgi:flagellin